MADPNPFHHTPNEKNAVDWLFANNACLRETETGSVLNTTK